jgi:hypothetical protein
MIFHELITWNFDMVPTASPLYANWLSSVNSTKMFDFVLYIIHGFNCWIVLQKILVDTILVFHVYFHVL